MASRKDVRFRMVAQDETARAINSVRSRFDALGRNIKGIFAGGLIAGAVTLGLSRVKQGVSETIDRFDDLAKRAKELSISPQVQLELRNVGSLVGVAEDSFTRLVVRLQNGTKEIDEALERIGIKSVEAFKKLAPTDQLLVVINQLSRIPEAADRTAAAVELAGERQSRALLRLVADGASAFKQLLDEQRNAGSEVANQASKEAEAFNDFNTRIAQGFERTVGKLIITGGKISNAIDDVVGKLTGSTKEAEREVAATIKKIDESFGLLADTSLAAKEFTFVSRAEEDRIEKIAKERERSLKEINREVKRLREEQERAEEAVLDNLISRLERVRDSLSEDREVIDALGGRSNVAPARQGLGAVEQGLAVLEQQKTNKLLDELVRFARTGNPAVFS